MGCSSNGFTVMVQSISEIGFQDRNNSSLSMSRQGLPSHCGHPLQLLDTKGRWGSIGGKHFLLLFSHCCWGQSLELWQLQQLQSILVPLRDSPIQEQMCLNILFIHSAMAQCRLCYRSFPTSLFYFRISRAFYQVEAFRGREYNDFNRNDGERPALVQILPILKHWALSTWVMLMRGKRRGAMRWTSLPHACTDPLLHIWGLSQAGDPNNCRYTCPAIAGNGSPGPLQQRTRLRTEVAYSWGQ